MATHFIYKLIDPRTKDPFYIGQTASIRKRLIAHLCQSIKDISPLNKKILEITNAGYAPTIETVENIQFDPSVSLSNAIFYERERYWILYYSAEYQLCNIEYNPNQTIEKVHLNASLANIQLECIICKRPVQQIDGKRQKLYCSVRCRVAFFRQKNAGEGVKKGRGRPRKHILIHPKKVYEASKLPDYTMDEAGKYAVGVDPHSKEPNKGKTVVYKKGSKESLSSDPPANVTKTEQDIRKVPQQEFHDNITGQVQKADTPRPKNWDTMGRIAQMKWLTAQLK